MSAASLSGTEPPTGQLHLVWEKLFSLPLTKWAGHGFELLRKAILGTGLVLLGTLEAVPLDIRF